MPAGPFLGEQFPAIPAGEACARIEGPRGEVFLLRRLRRLGCADPRAHPHAYVCQHADSAAHGPRQTLSDVPADPGVHRPLLFVH